MSAVRRPILRWHGGKYRISPWIIDQMPPHRVYVEPYGGAASKMLRKPRSYAEVYNDLDCDVVNLFRVLRDETASQRLLEDLRLTPFARDEFAEASQSSDCTIERARRLIIRSFMGFGSNGHRQSTGFRANSTRSGTIPAHDWASYADALPAIIERLKGVVIENRPAISVMMAHDGPETLHYVDPPYLPSTRGAGADYTHEMSVSDHQQLLAFLPTLRGSVMLSGYPSALYDDALKGWKRIERKALADGARERSEVLWMNFQDETCMFANAALPHQVKCGPDASSR